MMDIPSLLVHRSFVVSANVAAVSILIYDYLLTLHLEMTYIWGSKWSFVKILFLVTRYIPFGTLSFILILNGTGLGTQECVAVTRAYVVILSICTGAGEIILTLRTWTICAYTFEGLWWHSMRYVVLPSSMGYNSGTCVLVYANKVLYGCWACVAVFETLVIFLLAVQAYAAYKSGGLSKLERMIYGDGLVYYVYLTVTFIGAVISIVLLPPDMVFFLTGPTHAIHMSLTARVILHARKQARKSEIYGAPPTLSTFFNESY